MAIINEENLSGVISAAHKTLAHLTASECLELVQGDLEAPVSQEQRDVEKVKANDNLTELKALVSSLEPLV